MYGYSPARRLVGFALTAIIGLIAWFTVGHKILDKVGESNARSGGGGPLEKRIVAARRFGPIVATLKKTVGSEARLASVTVRPDSVEFEVVKRGHARGYRYVDGVDRLQTLDVGATGQAGRPSNKPWPISQLDPRAPERITRTISKREHGDFLLSIGDIQRAETGKLIWTMRGRIGERGVAWYAPPHGEPVKPFNPATPELSKGAALGDCIRKAGTDVAKVQRCVARFGH
ncbi:MAG: hypothetical protein QOJ07_3439 [Thermoleophilaceae bacterium]|nr:hypothetical protein [Thermoleophilaceae bacterium]